MDKELFTMGNMGRKIEKLRKLQGVKQDTLAHDLGISRQAVSKLEQSDFIDDEKLEIIARSLGLTVDAIKNFDEESTINFIQNNYDGSNKDSNYIFGTGNQATFNPLEKCMELFEKNEKLYAQLIQSEREKVELLQKLLDKK